MGPTWEGVVPVGEERGWDVCAKTDRLLEYQNMKQTVMTDTYFSDLCKPQRGGEGLLKAVFVF